MYLGANCISWTAKKQPTVAQSSTEAEYRALATSVAELTWICYIVRDIGLYLKRPPVLFRDNVSALYLTVNPVIHARTTHIEIDYHFVREKVALGALIYSVCFLNRSTRRHLYQSTSKRCVSSSQGQAQS